MKHSIEWLDDAVNAAPEERATAADLRLFINDTQNVTMHLLDGEVGNHVTVSLYALAHGLVHDWWSIFGARDREVSLRRYRTGYLLPDVRIRFDGAAFEISAHQYVYDDPDLRFWGGANEVMSREDGETWLTQLIQDILHRLSSKGIRGTSAALRWERVLSSSRSNERAFCEAAGGLGLDPYQISEDAADFIEKAELLFGTEALVEFVSGAKEVDKSRLITWVEKMARMTGLKYRLASLRPIVDEVARNVPQRTDEPAWAAGYRRARALRLALNLNQAHRFSSFQDLAHRLGAARGYNVAQKVDGIRALRRERPDGIHVHIRNHGDYPAATTGHLFALARAVGDAACFPEAQLAPINHLHHAFRQAAGRAFAAEFLAPIDEITSMQESKRDIFSIANEFAVAPAVVQHQIENKDRIAAACK